MVRGFWLPSDRGVQYLRYAIRDYHSEASHFFTVETHFSLDPLHGDRLYQLTSDSAVLKNSNLPAIVSAVVVLLIVAQGGA